MEQLYNERRVIFWIGFGLLLVSILFHAFKRNRPAVIFLLIASFFLFLYAAISIPFLMPWDERLHALVAKNMMKHPLVPTLYEEDPLSLPYSWIQTHIWVHKQPFFLWQSMLSFKIFGVNEFAYRFPGVLLGCAMVYACYRSGKLLGNYSIGYCAAFLTATSMYTYRLISGVACLDQNDLVFMEYISLSIWTMIEYLYSGKKYWIVLTGLFSGFAVLTKWVVGLLVYFIWSFYTLFKHKWRLKQFGSMLISLFITLVIAIPWQVYIFIKYPYETQIEYGHNLKHFTNVLDGHDGSFTFYINGMGEQFGRLVPFVILIAFLFFYFKSTDKKLSLWIIISIVGAYLFFSLAKTKMPSFTTVVIMPIYLSIAFLICSLTDWIFKKLNFSSNFKILGVLVVFIPLGFSRFDFDLLTDTDSLLAGGECFNMINHNKQVFQNLKLPSNAVLFNIKGYNNIDAMFYTGLPAYNFIPSESQYNELVAKGKRVAVFLHSNGPVPTYIISKKDIILLNDSLEHCE
ncbi:MAG TPA: glycosyltransferase family 39 protein [Bacteroidia bacterium]|nr:glycosyltransferase family 39 protein [Bacteroidia bacterium]